MVRSLFSAAAALLLSAVLVPIAWGDIITPTDLAVGDLFRVVFVTSTTTTATSPNLSTYDNLVNQAAHNAGLKKYDTYEDVMWQAIVSVASGTQAKNRLPLDSVPWYLVDASNVATKVSLGNSYTSLLHAINLDENGQALLDPYVWTGSWEDASGGDKLSLGYPPPQPGDEVWYSALVGNANKTENWLYDTFRPQVNALHLFAVSPVLTAVVPEPACLALWTLALAIGGGYGILRRR